jgi:hypothetical protein
MSTDEDARSNELTKKTKGRGVQEPRPFDKPDPTKPVQVDDEKDDDEEEEDEEDRPAGVK